MIIPEFLMYIFSFIGIFTLVHFLYKIVDSLDYYFKFKKLPLTRQEEKIQYLEMINGFLKEENGKLSEENQGMVKAAYQVLGQNK